MRVVSLICGMMLVLVWNAGAAQQPPKTGAKQTPKQAAKQAAKAAKQAAKQARGPVPAEQVEQLLKYVSRAA